MQTLNSTTTASGMANKAWWLAAAAALIAFGAVGATWISTWSGAGQRAATGQAYQSAAAQPASLAPMPAPAPTPAPATTKPAATLVAQAPAERSAPARRSVANAPACTTCGVVEAVTRVKIKGEGTGIGAVAGGVLGGVVGHQMGGGRGKDAMTVIGAVGGGVAGHEIEKRQRATTEYQVRVRMNDGTVRTVRQANSPAVGQRVRVDGGQLRVLG